VDPILSIRHERDEGMDGKLCTVHKLVQDGTLPGLILDKRAVIAVFMCWPVKFLLTRALHDQASKSSE
jgi:hypothetical protein